MRPLSYCPIFPNALAFSSLENSSCRFVRQSTYRPQDLGLMTFGPLRTESTDTEQWYSNSAERIDISAVYGTSPGYAVYGHTAEFCG